MSSRGLADELRRPAPVVAADAPVRDAVEALLRARLPALPVVDERGTLVGIFGEREFMAALFPGYLGQLTHASFVPRSLDTEIERRAGCLGEAVGRHANRERVRVREDYSDAQLGETFLHHRVLIVPVVDGAGRVTGVITRAAFFAALAARALALGGE
jgi:CBS domain-containing protein